MGSEKPPPAPTTRSLPPSASFLDPTPRRNAPTTSRIADMRRLNSTRSRCRFLSRLSSPFRAGTVSSSFPARVSALVEPKASKKAGGRTAEGGDVGQRHTSCRQKLWPSLTIFVHLCPSPANSVHLWRSPSIERFFAIPRHRSPKNDSDRQTLLLFAIGRNG